MLGERWYSIIRDVEFVEKLSTIGSHAKKLEGRWSECQERASRRSPATTNHLFSKTENMILMDLWEEDG